MTIQEITYNDGIRMAYRITGSFTEKGHGPARSTKKAREVAD